jgi:hypothetical protein
VVVVLVLAAVAAVVGYRIWDEYNPFFDRAPAVQEANALRDAVRAGPLSEEQFVRVTELARSERPVVAQTMIAVLELEAGQTPARKEPAVAVLIRLGDHPDPGVRQAAAAAHGRLTAAK